LLCTDALALRHLLLALRYFLQASAYMKRSLFHEWRLAAAHCSTSEHYEPLHFGLNLSTFVECLRILGGGGSAALDQPATLQVREEQSRKPRDMRV
jgi:hypothetical protein